MDVEPVSTWLAGLVDVLFGHDRRRPLRASDILRRPGVGVPPPGVEDLRVQAGDDDGPFPLLVHLPGDLVHQGLAEPLVVDLITIRSRPLSGASVVPGEDFDARDLGPLCTNRLIALGSLGAMQMASTPWRIQVSMNWF